MGMVTFASQATTTGERLVLSDENGAKVPFEDWSLRGPVAARAIAADLIDRWANDSRDSAGTPLVSPEPDGSVVLSNALVAGLSEQEAMALALPPAIRIQLEIETSGIFGRPGFKIETRWVRPGGLAARVMPIEGRLRYGGQEWRIAEPLWSTLEAIRAVNEAGDPPTQQYAMSKLRETLGAAEGDILHPDGFLKRLRISYAAGFSLDLKTTGGKFDFDPILFSRSRRAAAQEGEVPDSDEDGLLPSSLQQKFIERFRASDRAQNAYRLDDCTIVYLDPELKRALEIVHRAQGLDEDSRRKFALSPRRYISEAMPEGDLADDALSALFIETQQYSERVNGIDIWRKPVLPWIKPKPNSWLPESFGLYIGDPPNGEQVDIEPDQLDSAIDTLEVAVAAEQESVEIGGKTVPATAQALDALRSLRDRVTQEMPEKPEVDESDPLPGPLFLTVSENFEHVEYEESALGAIQAFSAPRFPGAVASTPKDHQRTGFNWLAEAWANRLPGVLLADDMGLGKTYQLLAFLAWLRHDQGVKEPFLIVAPTGLLENWRQEMRIHLEEGALGEVLPAFGSNLSLLRQGRGRDTQSGAAQLSTSAFDGYGVVLTTYETLRDYHMSFARQRFAVAVCDEAQKIKNATSQIRRAATTVNARFRIAMTGTPVENRLQDLWTIMDWSWPKLLGASRDFERRYPDDDGNALGELRGMLVDRQEGRPPVMLRRMKSEVLDGLPQKRVVKHEIEMPPLQAERYSRAIEQAMMLRGSGQRGLMLKVLHELRGTSLYPGGRDNPEFEPANSARMKAVFAALEQIKAAGEKALVFCEDLAMQACLAAEIRYRFGISHPVARIHGGVGPQVRQQIVNEFQNRPAGFDVLILSPKAGGVGLTLTAANHVIHASRWWNPAIEDQATDRVYRIGQTRDVTVHIPLAVHPDPALRDASFDFKLDQLMERKRGLSAQLLMPGETDGDLDSLFESLFEQGEPEPSDVPPASEGQLDAVPNEPATPEPPEEPSRPPQAERPVLSARVQQPAPPLRRVPRMVRYSPGDDREWDIFAGNLANRAIEHLVIRDPYALAGRRNRLLTADFATHLARKVPGISRVTVIAWDAESARNDNYETTQRAADEMEREWDRRFMGRVPLMLELKSRGEDRRFHDRWVEAHLPEGERLAWNLTSGVDGFMSTDSECTVTLWDE